MLQNIYTAGRARRPEAFGVKLKFENVIGNSKTMDTLREAEDKFPGVGCSLLAMFFPGALRKEEDEYWKHQKATIEERKAEIKGLAQQQTHDLVFSFG